MNQSNNELQLLRKREVMTKMGIAKTTLYDRIQQGLFPPPIALSCRCSVWPAHEVNLLIEAVIAGKSKRDQIELVRQLMMNRKSVF